MKREITNPDRFITGTIGEPGERAFYIQIRKGSQLYAVAIEKEQVRAISARLESMISEIRKSDPLVHFEKPPADDAPLETPVDPEFAVGAISLAWDDQTQLICFELYELEDDEDDGEGGVFVINISLGEASAFAHRSQLVASAGRLPCPFCSIPIDPRGHLCPRANGYRR